jgi:hypothetical protein
VSVYFLGQETPAGADRPHIFIHIHINRYVYIYMCVCVYTCKKIIIPHRTAPHLVLVEEGHLLPEQRLEQLVAQPADDAGALSRVWSDWGGLGLG